LRMASEKNFTQRALRKQRTEEKLAEGVDDFASGVGAGCAG
jgi:hypothetical protein